MLWQIYFWLFALLMVGVTIGRAVLYFVRPGLVSLYDIAEALPGLACVVAVYGYVQGVPIGTKALWIVLACIIPVVYVISMRGEKTRVMLRKFGRARLILLMGAGFLLTLPAYVALILYAGRFA